MSARAAVPLACASAALALLAGGCGGSSAAKSTSPTTTSTQTAQAPAPQASPQAVAAYQACLKAHGAGFVASGTRATAAQLKKLQPALKACASKRPAGANGRQGGFPGRNNPAFQKYADCLSKHGVTRTPGQGFGGGGGGGQGSPPAGQSAKFKAAAAACASLRPARPAGSPGN